MSNDTAEGSPSVDDSASGDETADEMADQTDGDDLFDPAEDVELEAGPLDDPVALLERDLAQAQQQATDFRDKLYRKAAELENTRRRLNKQMDDVQRYGNESLLKELLPVLDDLDRALDHAEEAAVEGDDAIRSVVDGVSLVHRKFTTALERFGVTSFESLNQPFDPQIHEALNQVASPDHPDGTIISEFLKGYRLRDRLLRPALVVVARNPQSGNQDDEGGSDDQPDAN